VWLWGGALIGLWLRVFEPSGPSLGITAATALGAFALGLSVPGQFLRAAQAVLRRLYPRKTLATPPVGPAGPETPRQMSQLLGVALIVAAGANLVSAMCLLAGNTVAGLLNAGSLLPTWLRLLAQLAVQLIAMMGWGVGAALLWQAQSLTRGAGRRSDAGGAREHEDWLWGLTAAAGITAFTWHMAWDPLLVGLGAGAIQVASGVILVRWPKSLRALSPVAPRRTSPPAAWIRLGVLARAAVTTLVATFQLRCLADLLGAALPQQALFAAVSIALLAIFHRRRTPKPHARSAAAAGAAVVVTAAVGMQLILGWVSLAGGPKTHWVLYVALTAQLPLAAALGLLAARQRQHFFSAGGSERQWEQWSLVGLAFGAGAGAALLTWPSRLIAAAPMALLVCMAGAIIVGITAFKRTGRQLTWTTAGGVLLLAMTLALTSSAVRATRGGQLSVSGGQWLTAWQQADRFGYLPAPAGKDTGWELDVLLGRLLAHRASPLAETGGPDGDRPPHPGDLLPRGRWLVVCRRPVINEAAGNVQVQLAAADPAIAELPFWKGRKPLSIWRVLQAGPFQYHGVFYGPMRADHPAARVVYRSAALRQAATRVARAGGVLIVHVPCAGTNAAPLIAVARTAHELFGEGVAVVRVGVAQAEMLLFFRPRESPTDLQELTQSLREHFAGKAFVLNSARLAPLWAEVPAVRRLVGPGCGGGRSVSLGQLRACCDAAEAGAAGSQ